MKILAEKIKMIELKGVSKVGKVHSVTEEIDERGSHQHDDDVDEHEDNENY